jgi:multimeric flavodoxin WrbA
MTVSSYQTGKQGDGKMAKRLKVVALLLSPRKLGNSEILVKEITRHIPGGCDLKLVRLTDKKILPCRGCYACLAKGKCPLDDDFVAVAEVLNEADALIIASPTYFLGANGMLKLFLDRCLQLFSGVLNLRGKPVLNLVTAGLEGEAGYSELMLNNFSLILGLELKASEVFYGALPGEVFLDRPEQLERAAELGRALLAEGRRKPAAWACPLCGSDVIQLLGGERVKCLACSNYGRLLKEGEEIRLEIELNPGNMFFTPEQVQKHGLWLQGMKGRFLELKDGLRKVCAPYADQGEWY